MGRLAGEVQLVLNCMCKASGDLAVVAEVLQNESNAAATCQNFILSVNNNRMVQLPRALGSIPNVVTSNLWLSPSWDLLSKPLHLHKTESYEKVTSG